MEQKITTCITNSSDETQELLRTLNRKNNVVEQEKFKVAAGNDQTVNNNWKARQNESGERELEQGEPSFTSRNDATTYLHDRSQNYMVTSAERREIG